MVSPSRLVIVETIAQLLLPDPNAATRFIFTRFNQNRKNSEISGHTTRKWKAARCVLFAQCELLVTVSMFVLILFCDIGQKGFDKQYRLDRHFESATHRSLAESLAIVAQQLSVESPAEVFK